jgi:hypothetical protein
VGIPENGLHTWTPDRLQQELLKTKVIDPAFVSCGSAKGKGVSGRIFNIYCLKGTKMMYAEPFSNYGRGNGLNWNGVTKRTVFGYEDETIVRRGNGFQSNRD